MSDCQESEAKKLNFPDENACVEIEVPIESPVEKIKALMVTEGCYRKKQNHVHFQSEANLRLLIFRLKFWRKESIL